MQRKKAKKTDSFFKVEQLLWSSKKKQWIELASIVITIVVTGQEDNKNRLDDKDAEEYNEAEKAFEDSLTGLCGVSSGERDRGTWA